MPRSPIPGTRGGYPAGRTCSGGLSREGARNMKTRKPGNGGLEVAPPAFGGDGLGWTADEPTSFRLLDAFVDAGFHLIDTAEVDSRWVPGNHGLESVTVIGKSLKQTGKREMVVIATEVGMETGPGEKELSKPYILREVERSLRRLRVDTVEPLPVAR